MLAAASAYVRLFDARVRLLAAGQLANTLGRGMAIPFLGVYFLLEKGFPLTDVAAGYAAHAISAVVFGLVAGAAADRFGRKPVMLLSLASSTVVLAAFVLVDTFPEYLAAMAVSGGATALYGPAARAMVADATPRDRRARAYGLLYLASNLGFGLGVVVGGALASASYTLVFGAASVGALAFFAVIAFLVRETLAPAERGGAMDDLRAMLDWRAPLTHGPFLLFVAVDLLFSLAWSLFNSYLPVYTVATVGLTTFHVGVIFAINGGLVVLLQLPASALAEREPRTRMLTLAALAMGLACLAFWAAGRLAPAGTIAFAALAGAMVVLTVSEMLRSPVQPALVADMARAGHVAKYMSFLDFSLATGAALGPLASSALYEAGRAHLVWPVFGALMLPAVAGFALLRARLPREVDDPRSTPPHGAPAPVPLATAPPR